MKFKKVIGQHKLKKQLIKSVNDGRISHAQLFLGAEGTGNLALALAFAQFISCEQPTDEDSCGVCKSCTKYEKLAHPDLHFVYPVNTTKSSGSNVVSDDFIQQWREALIQNPYISPSMWYAFIGIENKQGIISKNESHEIIRKINLKTYEAEYKIMIIWMPEKMNDVAANKLLKLIEEPPAKTIFLLVAENSEHIISTVLSRTQLLKVPLITNDELTKALIREHGLTQEQAVSVAAISNGNYLKALDVMETSEANAYNLEKFIEFMRITYGRKLPEIFSWVDEMATLGRERIKLFLEYGLRMVRENMILNVQTPGINYLTNAEKSFSDKFYPYINGRNVIQISEELNQAAADIERNAYNKIVLLDMALKIVKLIKK